MVDNNNCPICYENNESFSLFESCKHSICKSCITKHVEYSNKCPICGTLFDKYYTYEQDIKTEHNVNEIKTNYETGIK